MKKITPLFSILLAFLAFLIIALLIPLTPLICFIWAFWLHHKRAVLKINNAQKITIIELKIKGKISPSKNG